MERYIIVESIKLTVPQRWCCIKATRIGAVRGHDRCGTAEGERRVHCGRCRWLHCDDARRSIRPEGELERRSDARNEAAAAAADNDTVVRSEGWDVLHELNANLLKMRIYENI